jgi:hypothetical protein
MVWFWNKCALIAISVCLALTTLPGKDLVLCIGSHGHVALEFAQNGQCDEGPCRPIGDTPQAPGVNQNDHAGGDCLACVDIPLAQGPVAGPSSAFNGAKKRPSPPGSTAMTAVFPARVAQNSLGVLSCSSLSPPDGGASLSFPPRVLRI